MLYSNGSRGEAVKEIQRKVGVNPDGIFGPVTEKAVREFQKDNNLDIDGIVGPITSARLRIYPNAFSMLGKAFRNLWNVITFRKLD